MPQLAKPPYIGRCVNYTSINYMFHSVFCWLHSHPCGVVQSSCNSLFTIPYMQLSWAGWFRSILYGSTQSSLSLPPSAHDAAACSYTQQVHMIQLHAHVLEAAAGDLQLLLNA